MEAGPVEGLKRDGYETTFNQQTRQICQILQQTTPQTSLIAESRRHSNTIEMTNTITAKRRDRKRLRSTRGGELSVLRDFGRDAEHTRRRTKLDKRSPSPKRVQVY